MLGNDFVLYIDWWIIYSSLQEAPWNPQGPQEIPELPKPALERVKLLCRHPAQNLQWLSIAHKMKLQLRQLQQLQQRASQTFHEIQGVATVDSR